MPNDARRLVPEVGRPMRKFHDAECLPGYAYPLQVNELSEMLSKIMSSYQHVANMLIRTTNERDEARRLAEKYRDEEYALAEYYRVEAQLREQLAEARRLYLEERELRQQAHVAIHEARRLAEKYRDQAAESLTTFSVAGIGKRRMPLPWEVEK